MTVGNLAGMVQPEGAPRVLAVVLNWCAATDTAACVRSLEADSSAAFDILIVDNASPDGSGAVLQSQFPRHAFLQTGANLGYAGGNRRATDWALEHGYGLILIINDDAEVARGCVGELLKAMKENPMAAAAAPTILHHGTDIIWFAGGEFLEFKVMGRHIGFGTRHSATAPAAAPREVTFLTGCVLMLRATAVRELGGFRPEFFAYAEDLELSIRYRKAGRTLLLVPGALAFHKVTFPPPPDGTLAIALRDRNRRRLAALHYGPARRLAFAAWFYPTRVIHWVRFVMKGDRARAAAIWKGVSQEI